jgi:hypothetical protein
LPLFQNDGSAPRSKGYALAGLGTNHDRFNDRWIDLGGRLPFYDEIRTGSAAIVIFGDNEAQGLLRFNGWYTFGANTFIR